MTASTAWCSNLPITSPATPSDTGHCRPAKTPPASRSRYPALLQMTLSRATAAGWGGGPQTYSGPWSMSGNTGSVTEFRSAGDFEAVLTWVAGVRMQEPFRVQVFDSPPRLVVDVAR